MENCRKFVDYHAPQIAHLEGFLPQLRAKVEEIKASGRLELSAEQA